MNKSWEKFRLHEICNFEYGKGLPKRNRMLGKYAVYGSSGIIDYHKSYYIKGPGIIVGRKGSIGTVFYEKHDFFPIDTVFYVKENQNIHDKKYLYYLLKNLELKRLDTDAAVPGLNRKAALSQEIFLPSSLIQKKIASMLSAYDDLIENNNRRIEILEEIAQIIYKEWFVHFRFPGHEKIKLVDSELGKIPEGWEVKGILDSVYFHCVDKNASKYEGKKEYFATANIEGINIVKKGEWYSFIDKPSRAQKIPELYSVWYAKMKDSYKVLGFTEVNRSIADRCILSSGFDGFKAEKKYFPFVYFTIKSRDFHQRKDQYCTGAVQLSLAKKGLKSIKIIVPSEEIILRFCSITLPIINQFFVLQIKNDFLTKTRDLLLPKLISGEINVENLDIKTEDYIK